MQPGTQKKLKGNDDDDDSGKYAMYMKQGNFFSTRSKLEEALDYYKKALQVIGDDPAALIGKGTCLLLLGSSKEALKCFTKAQESDPNNAAAPFHCALIYRDTGQFTDAMESLEKSLSLDPENDLARNYLAQLLTDFGTRLKLTGEHQMATMKYMEAIQVKQDYAPAYYNIGVMYSEAGNFTDALQYYHSAVTYNPHYMEALCNIGVIYKNNDNIDKAIVYYEKALALNPNFQIARNNMAIALSDKGTRVKNEGDVKGGMALYKKALTYNFEYPDAYYNLGVAYGEQLNYDKAIHNYQLAIHFNPLCCEAYNNLGVIYKDRDNLEKSVQCYQSALSINSHFCQTLNNIGVVYTLQGKMDEAYASVKAAIADNPLYAEAYNNLGVLFRDEGNLKEAIECYDKCLELNPLSRNAAHNRLLALNYGPTIEDEVYQEHMKWGEQFSKLFTQFKEWKVELSLNRPLRIGYISGDFFVHSVSYFVEGLLMHHDPSRCISLCYSNVAKEDAKTQRLKSLAHSWRNIVGLSTKEAAELIRNDKVDILVELTGHTAGNRLDILAMKPAPIQITYIGYPNTTGLKTIDYRLSDQLSDPLETTQKYTEELVRLPDSFLCYTPAPDTGEHVPLPCLTNDFVTFGSFNNLAKINDEVIELWSSIMNAVPNSRLVVKSKPLASPTVRKKFSERFASFGITESRLDLLGLIPTNRDHLQAYQLMDLSLDTFPYSGTTTTCEALWMGVPVVTLSGKTHAQNVSASLLTTIGHKELIATTKPEYFKIALNLAKDVSRLKSIRNSLRSSMQNSPLCDSLKFTRNLEDVYTQVWTKHVKIHMDANKCNN